MFWLFGNFSRPGSRIRIRTTYVQIVHCTTNADPCHWPKLTPLEYRVDLCTSKDLLRDKKFHPTCSPTRIPAAVAAGLRSSARRCTPPPRPIQYNNVNPLVTNHFFFFWWKIIQSYNVECKTGQAKFQENIFIHYQDIEI